MIKFHYISLLPLLFLVGCAVPNVTSYYRPSVAVSSVYEPEHCVPLEKHLSFITTTRSASYTARATGYVYTSNGHPLLGAQYVISGRWGSIELAEHEPSLVVSGRTLELEPYSVSGDESNYNQEKYFNINVTFEHDPIDSYEIVFPKLLIDDEEVTLPPLKIDKTWWFGISPFNC